MYIFFFVHFLYLQLLKSQREVAQLRSDRRNVLSSVREKEEALEQSVEQERRTQAEVENLRSVFFVLLRKKKPVLSNR